MPWAEKNSHFLWKRNDTGVRFGLVISKLWEDSLCHLYTQDVPFSLPAGTRPCSFHGQPSYRSLSPPRSDLASHIPTTFWFHLCCVFLSPDVARAWLQTRSRPPVNSHHVPPPLASWTHRFCCRTNAATTSAASSFLVEEARVFRAGPA